MPLIRNAFKRLHYPVDIIAQCVRWYLAYALSLRNLEEMMAERGITVDHSTLHRWGIRLVPLLDKAFRRHKRAVGRRWRMDETYINIKGQWKYLYRAVDSAGQTIDFLLTARRDAAAALRFFRKAIRHHGEPEVVTIDKSGANTTALATVNVNKSEEEIITIRQNKYLNNLIEQDHRNIKRRIRLMLGFKSFRRAQTLLAGIELLHMIRKGQYQHRQSEGLSPAEQFYCLAAKKMGNATFANYVSLMRQSRFLPGNDSSEKCKNLVIKQSELANRLGVTATPAMVVLEPSVHTFLGSVSPEKILAELR